MSKSSHSLLNPWQVLQERRARQLRPVPLVPAAEWGGAGVCPRPSGILVLRVRGARQPQEAAPCVQRGTEERADQAGALYLPLSWSLQEYMGGKSTGDQRRFNLMSLLSLFPFVIMNNMFMVMNDEYVWCRYDIAIVRLCKLWDCA